MKYTAKDIEVLEGLEAVRRRPGMYIGPVDTPIQLFREILDNSIDEAINGYGSKITVTLQDENSVITVEDDGRGIPVDIHPVLKKPALEVIFTVLHAGGKFKEGAYVTAGGLHGVGASVVNALSEFLEVEVKRDGASYKMLFERGRVKSDLKKVGTAQSSGTRVTFKPDSDIFKNPRFNLAEIEEILRIKSYIHPGVTFEVSNKDTGERKIFHSEGGMKALIEESLEEGHQIIGSEVVHLRGDGEIKVEVAFAWTGDDGERYSAFVNGIHTKSGGSHLDALKNGIVKAVRSVQVHFPQYKNLKFTAEDIREGVVGAVSVFVPARYNLTFQGQTKDRFTSSECEQEVSRVCAGIEQFLNTNRGFTSKILDRINLAYKARLASKAASENIKRKISSSAKFSLPAKLADCSQRNNRTTELFIVEGDSAGGTAKQARNREFQAVLSLRGKILNTISQNPAKIFENREIVDLVSAIGTSVGDSFDISKVRYGKIIVITDADVDGMHISTLLLGFFAKWMRPLLEEGRVFLGRPPLYRVVVENGGRQKVFWCHSDSEKDELTQRYKNVSVVRFKGLGEMNPDQLWETTLNPKTRVLYKVCLTDSGLALRRLTDILGKDTKFRFDLVSRYVEVAELDR